MIDIETLKEYIKVLEDSSLAEIEIGDDENNIRLAKPTVDSPVVAFNAPNASVPAAPVSAAPDLRRSRAPWSACSTPLRLPKSPLMSA